MVLTPNRDCGLNVGIRESTDRWRDDLLNESRASSGRSQVGRGYQVSCSSNSETSGTYWK